MDRLNNGTVFFGVKPTSASLMTTASASSPWNQVQNLYFAYFSLDNLGGNIIDPETASAISDNSSKYTVADGSTIGCVLDLDDYDVRWYKLVDGAWVQITNSTAAATTATNFEKSLFDCSTRTIGSTTTVTTSAFNVTISFLPKILVKDCL